LGGDFHHSAGPKLNNGVSQTVQQMEKAFGATCSTGNSAPMTVMHYGQRMPAAIETAM
jgi:hypothetical protein